MKKLLYLFLVLGLFACSEIAEFHTLTTEAISKSMLGDHNAAVLDLEKAIEINPNHPLPYHLKGIISLNKNEPEEALIYFDKALELSSFYAKAYLGRSYAKYMLKDFEGAVDDSNDFKNFNNNHSESYWIRAMSKSMLGDHNAALSDINKAIEILPINYESSQENTVLFVAIEESFKPKQYTYLKDRANIYWWASEETDKIYYENALEDLNQAIILYPDIAETYMMRAYHKFRINDFLGSCIDINKSIELGLIMSEMDSISINDAKVYDRSYILYKELKNIVCNTKK